MTEDHNATKYYLIGEVHTMEGEHTEVLRTSNSFDGILRKADRELEGYLGSPTLATPPDLRIIKGNEFEVAITRRASIKER